MKKQTKATMISKETKVKVWERDGGCCVWCGAHDAEPNAHYIPRSRGGLGTEQNILTLCRKCHRTFDFPSTDAEVATSRWMSAYFKRYLKSVYENWNEKNLYYRRNQNC